MQQISPQIEPPNKSNSMKEVGWPSILAVITLLGSIIGTIYLGTTHLVDFNWLTVILGCLMLGITVFFAWYSIRTRQKLYALYNKDRTNSQAEYLKFRQQWENYFTNEISRWNTWAVDFSKQSDKEHRERTEELKRQCMEAIGDAERRLDNSIKYSQSMFTSAAETCGIIVDQYHDQLIKLMKEMDTLKKQLDEHTKLENEE